MADLKAYTRRMVSIGLMLGSLTAPAMSSDSNVASYEVSNEKLERFLTEYVSDDFSGTLLIVQNDKIIHANGYGFADREKNIPNTLSTVFETGEFVQYFTAAAILKLVEQNKLALDDTLPKFFDNVPDDKQSITIHHLLTHTSGLFGDEELDAFEQTDTKDFLKEVFSRSNSVSPAVYLPTFTFQAGERLIGFSEGYNLLALIVEKLSGQSFEAFLNDQLLKPAGIKNTGYQIPDWEPGQLANGYTGKDGENWGNLPDRLAVNNGVSLYMKGSMGLLSTVDDLYAWHRALYAGKILREDLVKLLHTPHIGMTVIGEADVDYGYGIELSETWTGTPWIFNWDFSAGRSNLPAFTARYNYFPEDNMVIIYASNEQVNEEFVDTINMLIRVLLEPDYKPARLDAGNQQ